MRFRFRIGHETARCVPGFSGSVPADLPQSVGLISRPPDITGDRSTFWRRAQVVRARPCPSAELMPSASRDTRGRLSASCRGIAQPRVLNLHRDPSPECGPGSRSWIDESRRNGGPALPVESNSSDPGKCTSGNRTDSRSLRILAASRTRAALGSTRNLRICTKELDDVETPTSSSSTMTAPV